MGKITRKIQPIDFDEKHQTELAAKEQARRIYTAELKRIAGTIRAMVTTLDTFSYGIEKHGECLERYRYDTSQLISYANSLQEIGAQLQQEASKIEQKSKFPPQ